MLSELIFLWKYLAYSVSKLEGQKKNPDYSEIIINLDEHRLKVIENKICFWN